MAGEDRLVVDYIDEFNQSFSRVTAAGVCDEFLDQFYRRFVAAHPDVAKAFGDTDMEHQKAMLRESLAEMADFSIKHKSNPYLVTLARIHGVRGHNIPVEQYDLWLDCLVDTVNSVDDKCTESVMLAWRIVLAPGIEFMKFYRDK